MRPSRPALKKEMPERTCLGCRLVIEKSSLVRFALGTDGRLQPDFTGRLSGRGAYTCPRESCLRAALKRNAFQRALKKETVVPGPDRLWEEVSSGPAGGRGNHNGGGVR